MALTPLYLALAATVVAVLPRPASAVPSMARQTNMACSACHTVYPELTPFGRQFKLRAYALGQIESKNSPVGDLPIAGFVQGSRTESRSRASAGAEPELFEHDRQNRIQAAGLYYGGKITAQSGALVQYFYDGFERKWMLEMADVRYADTGRWLERDVVFGFTLSNSPTLTDPYNSTALWSYPHTESAALEPSTRPLVDRRLSAKVAGPGAYALVDQWMYAELVLYRNTSRGPFRPFGWGEEKQPLVDGVAPYWRLAVQRESGPHSLSAGLFGLAGRVFPEGQTSGSTDRFRDLGFDAQYQYISGAHIASAQLNVVRERQRLPASFAQAGTGLERASLRAVSIGAHYYYERTYGVRLKLFDQSGSTDALRWDTGQSVTGSAAGSPNYRGWSAEVLYLPLPSLKLALRYTGYSRFNGGSGNYDGLGRDARGNDSLFALAWWLF